MVNAIGGKYLRTLKRPNKGPTKAENIMVTLLRTGIIGLKDWLY